MVYCIIPVTTKMQQWSQQSEVGILAQKAKVEKNKANNEVIICC